MHDDKPINIRKHNMILRSKSSTLYYHKPTDEYYIDDGLYLFYWNYDLDDWDDSDYDVTDEFFKELEIVSK